MSEDSLIFEDEAITIPVKVGSSEYTLTEASELASCRYQNNLSSRVTLGPDGTPTSVKNIADVESMFLADCLTNGDGKNVDVKIVRLWPTKIVKKIIKKLKEISELEEGGKEALEKQRDELDKKLEKLDSAKNEPSD